MNIPKDLLEKIINLRDLRQAIHAVRGQNPAAPLKKDDKALYGRSPTGEAVKPQLSDKARKEGAPGQEKLKPQLDDTVKILPVDEKPYGLKHLGMKKEYGQVKHMYGIPGDSKHYEVKVNKMGPKLEYSTKLMDSSTGGTIMRSPRVHNNLRDAVVEMANHFSTKRWS